MKFIRNSLVILILLVGGIVIGIGLQKVFGAKWEIQYLLSLFPTPSSAQINRACSKLLQQGRASELYAFYSEDTGSPADSAFYTIGALQEKWSVGKAMAFVWYTRRFASKGRQSPMEMGVAGAIQIGSMEEPMSLAQYTRAEQTAGIKVNGDMNAQVGPAILALISLHEAEMNRKFVVRFGDAIDW